MPVKIDPAITEELAAMDLVIWEAKHPKRQEVSPKTGKMTTREDKGRVLVSIAGPGVQEAPGGGKTLREAVDAALGHSPLAARVPGLRGAMMRLEKAILDLAVSAHAQAHYDSDYDDDIPF